MIAQASLSRPEDYQRRIEELESRLREAQCRLDESDCRHSDTRRTLDDVRRDRDRYRDQAKSNRQSAPSSAMSNVPGPDVEAIRRQLTLAFTERDNHQARSTELVSWLLQNRFNVEATSSVPDTEVRPHPYFRIDRTAQGATLQLTVPIPEQDVVMRDGSLPGAIGYTM